MKPLPLQLPPKFALNAGAAIAIGRQTATAAAKKLERKYAKTAMSLLIYCATKSRNLSAFGDNEHQLTARIAEFVFKWCSNQ
jgi:hypothetical protein